MGSSGQNRGSGGAAVPHIDRWLRLDPATEARYERDTGAARRNHLRHIIIFGLLLYNIYNLTGPLLMPDIAPAASVVRIGVVTPAALLLAWAVLHLTPVWRERAILVTMTAAHLMPTAFFAVTRAELGAYTFAELTLTMVYGNMLLALRFRHAALFTAIGVIAPLAAVALRPDLPPQLAASLAMQMLTAGIFSLYATYLLEWRRCDDYVTALLATMRAERAEESQQRLTVMSQTDPLTGLPNRRYLDERLADWCAAAAPLAVLMIDVDHFKPYNDTYGHHGGDDCLRLLAQAFHATLPVEDAFCARFGGEEFIGVLRGTDRIGAQALAARIRDVVQALAIPHAGRRDGTAIVTVSIGVALSVDGENSATDLLAQSDAALYRAKRGGRNRVTLHDPPARVIARAV
ncbi:diguanylate cyclase (GGDEF) domain-containing protein [Loktanella fryxellensis]|uniref:diguanylate cyclase n=1 Tax=Loktanella fryxellensis TaxID=245187 RepID=A0A1H8B0U0_9RHOB|nr:GGDEF domain-containing protein [Loktanella fryxellensis]SEM76505.1 diguanylate cyclase (GGDEF) domain-containing protein [Loktanella fryxellensis]